MENLANNKVTQLASNCLIDDLTITVLNSTDWPAANFRVRVGNEYMLVTSKGSGSELTWTVTREIEGTTKAAYAAGTPVYQVMTAGGIEQFVADRLGATVGLRHFATRCDFPTQLNSGQKESMSRSSHFSMADVDGDVYIEFPNYKIDLGRETPTGSSTNMTAAIEKVDGTLYQVKFGGAVMGTAASGATLQGIASDVVLKKGELFWLRVWRSSDAGMLYGSTAYNSIGVTDGIETATFLSSGEGFNYGASRTDVTMATGPVSNNGTFMYRPSVIAAYTDCVAVVNFGDSKSVGQGDSINSFTAARGNFARSVEGKVAYAVFGLGSETLYNLTSNATYPNPMVNRIALVNKYFTHVYTNFGMNDFFAVSPNRTAAQFASDLAIFCSKFTIPVIAATAPPRTTSTDSWATVENQTVATNEAQRVLFNNSLRAGALIGTSTGCRMVSGYFDYADALESGRNSGKWKVSTKPWTADGIHESQWGYIQAAASGFFDVTKLSAS